MFKLAPIAALFGLGILLTACSGELSPTTEELSACAQGILKHGSVGVRGDEYGYRSFSGTSGRSVQINYPSTNKRPGFTCTIVDGENVEIVRFDLIFPTDGKEL